MPAQYESPWLEIAFYITLFSTLFIILFIGCHLVFNQPRPRSKWTKVGYMSDVPERASLRYQ